MVVQGNLKEDQRSKGNQRNPEWPGLGIHVAGTRFVCKLSGSGLGAGCPGPSLPVDGRSGFTCGWILGGFKLLSLMLLPLLMTTLRVSGTRVGGGLGANTDNTSGRCCPFGPGELCETPYKPHLRSCIKLIENPDKSHMHLI